MPRRRTPTRGLWVPQEPLSLDLTAALAQSLRSLWVPGHRLGVSGITNLVTDDTGAEAVFPNAAQTPLLTSTDYGPGLQFDGTDDIAVRSGAVPYNPAAQFGVTVAIACRIDSIAADRRVLYGFTDVAAKNSLELRIANGFTSIAFTGDNHATSTPCDIYSTPNLGQVVLIAGVIDSLTNARLSYYEPATGNFQSGFANNGITTQATVDASTWSYEALGGFYGGGASSRNSGITLLDAWFWDKPLTDDELELWRQDRWSVLQPQRRRTHVFQSETLDGARIEANQTLPLPTQVATATRLAGLQHNVTLPPVTQDAYVARLLGARQAVKLLPPTQVATVKVVATAMQGRIVPSVPAVTLDTTSVTWDSTRVTVDGASISAGGVTADSGLITCDSDITCDGGGGLAAPPSITLDSTYITWDSTTVTVDGGALPTTVIGLVLPPVTQFARIGALPPGTVRATQTLPPVAQAATASAPAAVGATQSLPLPTQVATATAAAAVSKLGAQQQLPPVSQTATATVLAKAAASQLLPLPTQVARVARQVESNASAVQLLPLPTQVARVEVYIPPVTPGDPLPPVVVTPPDVTATVGDLENMVARQAMALPPWWGPPGIIPAVLRVPVVMAGAVGVYIYDFLTYARKQTRILTATGFWVDLIAFDFFGNRIRRRDNQSDDAFRRRILLEMFRERVTRPALRSVLKDMTGYEPIIFEPGRPSDVGGVGMRGRMGVGVAGRVGSIGLPGEFFVDVFRDPEAGIPRAAGVGSKYGGVGIARSRLVVSSLDSVTGALRDEDIYEAVNSTRAAGITAWVRIRLGRRT